MDIFEFELRYKAFEWFARLYKQDWDQKMLISLVTFAEWIKLDKKIQEVTPEELKTLTESTYGTFKKKFLKEAHDVTIIPGHTLFDYIERMEYELKVIKEMGFNTYFLIVADFVQRSKANEIMVGPGRWSGAWSLLAYSLSITDVDPLLYGLLFERFLNPARITMPDFDIDFEDTLRDEVITYVTQRYGRDKVCAIGTYMQLATKAAFKDSARTLGIPFDKANLVSNMITDASFTEMLDDEKTYEEFNRVYQQDALVKQAVDLGITLEWNLRQLWVHACGIVISPDVISTHTPVQPIIRWSKKEEWWTLVSQYDGKVLETLGLLKMDFLGLRNLSVIKNCIKILRAKHKKDNKPLPEVFEHFFETMSFEPPLDDEATYEQVFQTGDTTGIFQFEGDGMRRFLIQLKATEINDLIAMSALYRPGPMDFIPRYIARKHGEEAVSYMPDELRQLLISTYDEETANNEEMKLIEDLDPIMGITYGIAVYQEQLMFLVQSMAGFSLAEADILRRWVGKKILEVIEKLKKEFVKKSATHRDYKDETSTWIYEKMIEPAARYSFNKSHSVCYSLIAYQTWYLKAHYPVEFYAALLRSKEEDTDRLSMFIDEVKEHGIAVLLPDVNESFNHVSAIEGDVRLWFLSVKGIGYDVGEFIESERIKNGAFSTLEDFLTRCQSVINKKSLEWLIKSGSLDLFGSRKTFLTALPQIQDWWKQSLQASDSLFGGTDLVTKLTFDREYETTLQEAMMMEYGVFKTFVSVHPFDWLYAFLKKYTFITQMKDIPNYGQCVLMCFIKEIRRARKKWFFVTLEDVTGTIDVFFKEKLDYKVFDVVLVTWYKWHRMSLNKIETIDLQALRDDVKRRNLYDPKMTAAYVKSVRNNTNKEDENALWAWIQEEIPTEQELEAVDEPPKETGGVKEFIMPDTIPGMVAVRKVLSTCNAGKHEVDIAGTKYMLTDEWLTQIEDLCEKIG